MQSERRQTPRLTVPGLEPLAGRLETIVSIVPLNLSETGMCARMNQAVPEHFSFTLELPQAVRLNARRAWQRSLPNGQFMVALRFENLSQRTTAALRRWQKSIRRAVPRRADFLPVEVVLDGATESFSAVASDVSRAGLQLNHDGQLKPDSKVTLLLPLDATELLELQATVRWQKDFAGGTTIGMQFVQAPSHAMEVLDRYVQAEPAGQT